MIVTWLGLLATFGAGSAHAADITIHSGDPAEAAARAAEASGVPVTNLELVTMPQLLEGRGPKTTAGALQGCAGAPAPAGAVQATLNSAEALLVDMDFDTALGALQTADETLLCVSEPLEPQVAARIQFLRGVVLHFSGDGQAARSAYRQALRIQPGLEWDANFPPSAATEFENAKRDNTSAPNYTLAIVPRSVGITVDGRPIEPVDGKIQIAEGAHLLQIGSGEQLRTVRLQVGAPASLMVPGAVPADAVAWADDPALSTDLTRVLSDALEPGKAYLVVTPAEVYRGTAGSSALTPIGPAEPQGPSPVGVALTGTGSALLVGGAVLALSGYGAGQSAIDDASAEGARYEDWEAAQSRYDSARGLLGAGKLMMLGGVALASGGAALMVSQDVRIAPLWLANGGGLAVTVRGR